MSEVQEVLQNLVRISSPSGEEDKLAAYILDWFKSKNIDARLIDRNIFVFLKGKSDHALLVFNGHMDTVSAGEETLWTYPPVGPDAGVIKDGKLYGLGASDMKGSLAAFMMLALYYRDTQPEVDLLFTFVTEEETSGMGTVRSVDAINQQYKKESYKYYGSIVGEPTSLKFIEIGNRGAYFYKYEVSGDSCHAAQAQDFPNSAPKKIISAINDLAELEKRWQQQYRDDLLGLPLITVTGITTSESSVNQVPSAATVSLDLRLTPELEPLHEEELNKLLAPYSGKLQLLSRPCPAAKVTPDAKIIKAIKEALPEIELRAARGGNDSGTLSKAGIPAVTFAPGIKEVIHSPDEYTLISQLEMAISHYKSIIATFSKSSQD
jgi:acetylornithine deacetylase